MIYKYLPYPHVWARSLLVNLGHLDESQGKEALRITGRASLGGTVVENPLANAGDTGSSPGPGRSHVPRSNEARAPQLLSLRATTTEAHAPRACAPQQEKPTQREACTRQRKVAPARRN